MEREKWGNEIGEKENGEIRKNGGREWGDGNEGTGMGRWE